jgi:aflatoxin B1 aldehyde reductase
VKEWMKVCEEGGYIKPTVYQGHYNALCRQGEEKLFPLLREHGVKFYAFGSARFLFPRFVESC